MAPPPCSAACTVRSITVQYYCKECSVYLCDACVAPCKTAHPDLVLDNRVLFQRRVRASTLSKA